MSSHGDDITKILTWPEPAKWSDFQADWGISKKLDWRVTVSCELKDALLDQLRMMPGVSVTNELVGSRQAIVSAPAKVWDILLNPSNPVIPREILVVENGSIASAAPARGEEFLEFSEADRARLNPPRWVGQLDLKLGTQPAIVLSWVTAAMTLMGCYRRVRRGLMPQAHKPSSTDPV